MTTPDPPLDKAAAVEFARASFASQFPVMWIHVVRYAELSGELNALKFALKLYTDISTELHCVYWLEYLRELDLRMTTDASDPRVIADRARVIWDDGRDRSSEKRGIARLYWAFAARCEGDAHHYEREVGRALELFSDADAALGDRDKHRVDRVLTAFDKELA